MLSILRKHAASTMIKVILGLIVIVFVFWGFEGFNSDRSGRIAMVNGQSISLEQYRQTYNNLIEGYRRQYGERFNDELLKILDPRQRALDALIDQKLLELFLRRLKHGENLVEDRNSIEFHMRDIREFEKLKESNKILGKYLEKWNYLLDEPTFWDRFTERTGFIWRNIKDLFSNFSYLRLSLTQRNSAYFFYGIVVFLFVLMSILVPMWWGGKTENPYN